MPFTFSHPALVIPLLRVQRRWPWLSATGLIAGSIAPDFEKFYRLGLGSYFSHSPRSIFYFSLPVGLALALVFHLLVRGPLLTYLPEVLRRRVGRFGRTDWWAYFRRYWWGVLLSIVIGAALHLAWDAFTHENDTVAALLPYYEEPVLVGGRFIPMFQLMNVANSVLGGLIIAWAVWRMPTYRRVSPPPPLLATLRYWGMAAAVALALLLYWSARGEWHLLNLGIAALSAAMLGLVAASAFETLRLRLKR